MEHLLIVKVIGIITLRTKNILLSKNVSSNTGHQNTPENHQNIFSDIKNEKN